MAKVTAPLLSFGGSGQIAKTQVYGKWRGIPYARRYVIPANKQSDDQMLTRNVFSWLNAVWKQAPAPVIAAFTAFTAGKPLINRNAFIKSNLSRFRGSLSVPVTVIDGLVTSPGANAGLAAGGFATADDMSHGLTVTLTAPTLPTGWSIVHAHFVVYDQQDPHSGTDYIAHAHDIDVSAYTYTFAAIGAATYVATGFFEYTKPDGSTAFSPSLANTQIVA